MKQYLLLIGLFLSFVAPTFGQMSLTHLFPGNYYREGAIVNLTRSGQKIMIIQDFPTAYHTDTMFFYNMDYSFWKMIICPYLPGFSAELNFLQGHNESIGIFYPSETLFNLDTFLEVGVIYLDTITGTNAKFYVINENGHLVDSILNTTLPYGQCFHVYRDSSGHFNGVISTYSGVAIYSLPGTLPCETCVNATLSISQSNENPNNIITEPIPNPSKDQVKITFTLPDGVSRAELDIYNTSGQKIKSYQVDNRFGFIMVDNSQLASGVYYYNIVANGVLSSSQKMLVIK